METKKSMFIARKRNLPCELPSLHPRGLPIVLGWGVLLVACLAAPARAQMGEDAFLQAAMPALMKMDFSGPQPLSAMWLAPEFFDYELANDKDPDVSGATVGRKFVEQALIFVLAAPDGKPMLGLKAAAAEATLHLPDGSVLPPIRMPAPVEKEFAGSEKDAANPSVMLAFRARRADGSATLPPGPSKIRLEVPGPAKAKPHLFEWTLPLPYPAAVRAELKRSAEGFAARFSAYTVPDAELAENMIAWLLEFQSPGGSWLGIAWCPAEWWELSWKSDKDVDANTRAAFRTLFNDLTAFVLLSFDGKDPKRVQAWADRCVLIDSAGTRHTPVKLPEELQAGLSKGFAEGARSAGLQPNDATAYLVAFKIKLDSAARQPFRIVLQDAGGKPTATFRWHPPLPMPPKLAEALQAARQP